MKIKGDEVLVYRDSEMARRYGTGVVTSVTPEEYTILWSGRGSTKYRRSILDERLERTFQILEAGSGFPKQRHLHLGSSKVGIAFNENYDRSKVGLLCDQLKVSGAHKAQDVADGLKAELFTKKLALRGAAKAVLWQLAELCNSRGATRTCDEARNISKELFFGYVLQKSDFTEV
jgi:hypothetical protein